MIEVLIGQVILFAGNFEINGFVMCDGREMQVMEHTALFSILGTTYGGNGVTTFKLPDLRNRVPVGTTSRGGIGGETKSHTETVQSGTGKEITVGQNSLVMSYQIALQGVYPSRH